MKLTVAIFTLFLGLLTNPITQVKSAPSYVRGTGIEFPSSVSDDTMLALSPPSSNFSADQSHPKRCDVLYDGRCYIVYTVARGMALGEARRVCQDFGGRLADIYDEAHFNLIRAFMRSQAPMGYTSNHAWTAMEVDVGKRTLKTSTGEWAEYVKWHKGYPKNPARPFVALTANINNVIDLQGFWDAYDTANPFGCICQL